MYHPQTFVPSLSIPWRVHGVLERSNDFIGGRTVRVCSVPKRRALFEAPVYATTMGLNAKSLKKTKGRTKKGSSSATKAVKKGQERRATPSTIDTTRKEYIFQMHRLSKTLPSGKSLLNNINLAFFPGAKIGVLGDNGSGKSTLLKIMAGVDKDFDGEAQPQRGIRIGYLEQEPKLTNGDTVAENVEASIKETKEHLKRYSELGSLLAKEDKTQEEKTQIEKELERVQDQIEAANGWELERTVERALDALRCPPGAALIKHLSGGEKRRVAMCALLLKRPELLILDEPTNELDAESVLWLQTFLQTYSGTVVAVTHDRYFMQSTQWILELDRGKGAPYEGTYSTYLEKKARRMEEEEKVESSRQRLIKAELEWIRSSPKGRQAKSKARVAKFNELVNQEKEASTRKNRTMDTIYIPPGRALGDIVVEAEDARKVYGDRILFENMTFSLPPGGIVGVVGANGTGMSWLLFETRSHLYCGGHHSRLIVVSRTELTPCVFALVGYATLGKTTLFKIITGAEQLDGGSLKVGETVDIAYVDQSRSSVNHDRTVFEEISDGNDEITIGTRTVQSRAYLSWFNFKGADQQKKVGYLSGGELNRLNMAKVFMKGSNLLLLDEPTNDGDFMFLKSLENALLNYAGCAVIISHDRFFLDRVATHILAFEGDSRVVWHEGNWQSYMEDKTRRLGDTTPSRVKFAKLPEL